MSEVGGNDRLGIGPQPATKSELVRRLRFHQSWYRANVLKLPYGKGPTRGERAIDLGNMLADPDAAAGKNFIDGEIRQVVDARIGSRGGVEAYRCRHNMLSSQPMCFNLFGPLVNNLERRDRLWKALAESGADVGHVTRMEIEFAPPKEACLNDNTSFDAYVEYSRPDGRHGLVGIETKLSEPFTRRVFENETYWTLSKSRPDIWPESSWPYLADPRWAQLWRNHMLAVAHQESSEIGFADAMLMVVYHDRDASCRGAVQGYRSLLGPAGHVVDFTLGQIIESWRAVATSAEVRWLDAFSARYVDLSASELAFQHWVRSGRLEADHE